MAGATTCTTARCWGMSAALQAAAVGRHLPAYSCAPAPHRYVPESREHAVDRIHERGVLLREEEARDAIADHGTHQRLCQGCLVAAARSRTTGRPTSDLHHRFERSVEKNDHEDQSTDA